MSTQTRKNISNNKNKKDEDSKNTVKKTVMFIILIIIIILSLITSCSCTSGFFGRIGDIFRNDGNVDVDDGTKQRVKVKNQDLKFDKTELEISLGDTKAKLSFSYKNINPKEYTCTTSDASIATCYVSDGYVVINPKKAGKVTVTLSTDTNGKTYQATADVTIIDDIKRQIKLSSKSGTINMAYGKTKSLTYSLVGLEGDVTVSLSNPDIADVKAENGVLKITAKKTGKTTITLSLNYDGKEYKVVYNLNVINDKNSSIGKPGKPNKPSKPGDEDNMGEGGDNPENPNEPSNPENPDNPDVPVEPVLDNNTRLKKLDLSWIFYDFNPETREYGVKIASWRKTIKIDAVPESDKARVVSYSLNGVLYTGEQLKEKLPLQEGDNVLVVTVQAEDGTMGSYKVVINKPKSNNSLLKDLSSSDADGNEIKFDFNKNTLYYEINVPNSTKTINFDAIPRSKKATVEYTFNNNTVTSLNNLYLRVGVNVLEIKVTSEDKMSVTTYKVVINRELPDDAVDRRSELISLTDTLGKLDFNPYEQNYNIAVSNDTEKIGFTAKTASPNATVVYKFNGIETTNIDDLTLNVGNNIFLVEVTAPDGVTKTTYQVNINRANKDNSNVITNIEVLDNKGVLIPKFDENQLNYTVDVDENTSEIGFKVETNATDVTYKYNGSLIDVRNLSNLPLNKGENKLTIEADNRTYTVIINRKSDKSSDVSLKDLTLDGESIISTFDKNVDKDTDSVKLNAIPNDDKASVKYYFNGKEMPDGEIKPLEGGANVVTVVVTAEDGTEKSYEVIINKEVEKDENDKSTDASLKEFLINGENALGTNEINLGSNEEISSIIATPNDKNASVTGIKYEYNGTTYTASDLDTLKNELNKKLNPGESVNVIVEVTAEDGVTKKEYAITIKKDEKPVIKGNYLTDLTVKDNKAELFPNFASDVYDYIINVNDNENSITLLPTADGGKIEYKIKNSDESFTDFKELQGGEIPVDLTNGDKNVIIRVSDADGKSTEYEVKVHKTVRTIEVTSKSDICYIEDKECIIEYVVKEDGIAVSNYDTTNLDISGLPEGVKYEHVEYGKIKLIPNGKLINADTDVTVNLGIKDYNSNLTSATVKFTTREHKIWSDKGSYDLPYLDDKKDRTIILNTDPYLLTGDVSWTVDSTGKILTIETEDRRKVVVEASGPVKVEYIGSKVGNNSLPIKITATGTGNAYLNVSGSAYGKEISGPTIEINVKRGYLVTLIADNDANDKLTGLFDETTPYYEIMLSVDNPSIDLSKYPKPYLITDDECHYYEFKQYIVQGTTKTYTGEEIIKYEDLNDNLILVAEYDMSTKEVLETQSRTVMVTDIPLFYNKDAVANYGEDKAKMIYPSASGKYTIEVNNKGTQDMKVTGMFIEENTVCVDGGCLNMGYIIRDEAGTYYMGDGTTLDGTKTTPTYSILNKNATSSSSNGDELFYKNEIKLEEAQYLLIPAGETREITIHWKWVDAGTHEGDLIDTKIGNKAAELGNIDLMYQVSVGINFDVILDKCIEAPVESGN